MERLILAVCVVMGALAFMALLQIPAAILVEIWRALRRRASA